MPDGAAAIEPDPKWKKDAFLDKIRSHSDELANDCVRRLRSDRVKTAEITSVFRQMQYNGAPIPDKTPDALREFLERTKNLPTSPDPIDSNRLTEGQSFFMLQSVPSALVLACKSIPEGYAAPSLARILNISGQLRDNPYHRLMGTLRFLIDVASPGGFEVPEKAEGTTKVALEKLIADGKQSLSVGQLKLINNLPRAIITTQKVRLMHAGVRINVAPEWEDYDEYVRKYGTPINLEDMLGTMIGFSMLVVAGLRKLRVTPEQKAGVYTDEEEAYYYVWRTFGRMFGIYPTGQPNSIEYIPQTLTEAKDFYDSYRRRHYVGAEDLDRCWRARSWQVNPDGVDLADAHLRMAGVVMKHMFPRPLRPFIPGPLVRLVPRIYLRHLIGDKGCARIGVRPVTLMLLLKWVLINAPRVWARLWERVKPEAHIRISKWFLLYLIRMQYDKKLGFIIPSSVGDLINLVESGWKTSRGITLTSRD